jgi:hypothetical protein
MGVDAHATSITETADAVSAVAVTIAIVLRDLEVLQKEFYENVSTRNGVDTVYTNDRAFWMHAAEIG